MGEEPIKDIKQVCRIEIVFPVESDDKAMEIKKGVSVALKDVPSKRFTFSIAEN